MNRNIENEYIIEKLSTTKSWLFEKTDKIDTSVRPIKKKVMLPITITRMIKDNAMADAVGITN